MKFPLIASLFAIALASCGAAPAYAEDAQPSPPANACVTLDGVKQANAAARPEYLPINDIQFRVLKSALAEQGTPLPDEIASAVLAHTEAAEGTVFILGFDKDGCSHGMGRVSEAFIRHVFGTTDS